MEVTIIKLRLTKKKGENNFQHGAKFVLFLVETRNILEHYFINKVGSNHKQFFYKKNIRKHYSHHLLSDHLRTNNAIK